MLQDQDRQKLDGIVQQMTQNKESDQNIQAVVNDFKTKYDQPVQQKQGLWGNFKNSVTNITPPTDIFSAIGKTGIGLVKNFAQDFTGSARLASKGAKAIGIPQAEMPELATTKSWADKSNNVYESIGKEAGNISEFASGEGLLGDLAKIPKTVTGVRLAKAGIGAILFGTQKAAKSGSLQGVPEAAKFGLIAPGASELIGGAVKSAVGSLSENVGKALGFTGKMNVSDVTNKIPQATRALETIANNAKNIVVKDIDGIEKTFEPTKATFGETLQALKSTKESIYKQYSDLATKAGDAGAKFTQEDFGNVISKLKDIANNRTTPYAQKANQILSDITRLFPEGESDLPKIQSLIEDINKDVNPLSDKASAEVSSEVSKTLREIMDNKIVSSTHEGYQSLRSQYSDLKSVENDLINRWKRSVRGTGSGVSKWVEGFGTLDTAVALLTGNVGGAIKGAGMFGLGNIMKYLKDPEVNLQKAFGQILKKGEEKASSGIGKFLFDSTPASEPERQAAKESLSKATAPIRGIPVGMSLKDVSPEAMKADMQKRYDTNFHVKMDKLTDLAKNFKEFWEFERYYYGSANKDELKRAFIKSRK